MKVGSISSETKGLSFYGVYGTVDAALQIADKVELNSTEKGQGLKPCCSIDLTGMTEVMPFYKTAFEGVFSSSCEVRPFYKTALEGTFSSSCGVAKAWPLQSHDFICNDFSSTGDTWWSSCFCEAMGVIAEV
jgi:hypothetical protein